MSTLFKWLITFPIAIVVVTICLMNIDPVSFSWSPFHSNIQIPYFAPVLAALGMGFVWGGFMVWINTSPIRKQVRDQKKKIKKLEKEIDAFASKLEPKPDTTPKHHMLSFNKEGPHVHFRP